MPYINPILREKVNPGLLRLRTFVLEDAGVAAYCVFQIALWLLSGLGRGYSPSFQDRATVYGMLCSVAEEFKRRYLDPYEDGKREANGDV